MESIESTYKPISLDEKAFLFFPSSTNKTIKRNRKKLKKARKAVGSSTSDKLSMTTMKGKRFTNSMNTSQNIRFITIGNSSTNKNSCFSYKDTPTNPKIPLKPSNIILNLEKLICHLTSP